MQARRTWRDSEQALIQLFDRLDGASLFTFKAKYALGGVGALAAFLVTFHVHRADLQALAAADAFAFVAVDTEKRKVAHWLEEQRDRADVFAEGAVVLEGKGENDADEIIQRVAAEEEPEHDAFQIADMTEEERRHQSEGQREHDVTEHSESLSRLLRLLIGQKVEDHRRPACVTAPAASENQRSEYLGDRVVNGRRFKHAGKKIIPEALDLHILIAHYAEIDQHIGTDRELHEPSRVLPAAGEERQSDGNAGADVAEIEKIEDIVQRPPESDGYGFKYHEHEQGWNKSGYAALFLFRLCLFFISCFISPIIGCC